MAEMGLNSSLTELESLSKSNRAHAFSDWHREGQMDPVTCKVLNWMSKIMIHTDKLTHSNWEVV